MLLAPPLHRLQFRGQGAVFPLQPLVLVGEVRDFRGGGRRRRRLGRRRCRRWREGCRCWRRWRRGRGAILSQYRRIQTNTNTSSPLSLCLSLKMLLKSTATTTMSIATTPALFSLFKPPFSISKLPSLKPSNSPQLHSLKPSPVRMSWLNKLGFGVRSAADSSVDSSSASIAQGPDDDIPAPGQQFAQFGAGCFWGVELAFQRVPGVSKTEVGYTQGYLHNPTYEDICSGTTNHSEVVRVQYDPKECSYETLLDVFWARHDPTTPNRQGNDVGTQYRSGIYFYTPEQEKTALESKERQQNLLNRKIVSEILPAKKFYRAEEYHQQYLAKGGRFGFRQSSEKGCNDPIRCYG